MDSILPVNFQAEDAPQILEQVRPLLDLPEGTQFHVETVTHSRRGTRIEFTFRRPVELDGGPTIHCVSVETTARGELRFDARGTLVARTVEPADEDELRALRVQLERLIASGQVYLASPGEQVDPDTLRARGQSWYVEAEPDGKQYLRRAWIT